MNRKTAYKGKPNSREFARYYLDYTSTRDPHASLYPHMLIEDMHLGIMPIGGKANSEAFGVQLTPASKKAEELVRAGLITHHGEPWDVTEALCDFVDEVAHILATYGKAYYEIIYVYENESRERIEGFMIQVIPNHCIKEAPGICWQYVPRRVFEQSGKDEELKRFVWSFKKDLLTFAIPKELGGVWKFRRLLRNLNWLSRSTIPEFAMKDMEAHKQTKGYDFSVYRQNQDSYLAKITRKLGWSARQTFVEEILEFEQIYRHLKFERSKSVLRQHIVDRLNAALATIGDKVGFKARIELQGVPTPPDFDKHIDELRAGKIHKFSDVYNFIYDWRK